jgi:8-oxo-dGTP pyrophosphatase MutT (NUDIX family)
MADGQIRPIAICLFRDGDRILVAEYHDTQGEPFFRPPGGAIRFGEYGHECIVREIREELGTAIRDLTYKGTIENLFSSGGLWSHEIVLVFKATFVDPSMYKTDSIRCHEDDGSTFVARWISVSKLQSGEHPMYPDGILDYVDVPSEEPLALRTR